MHQHGAVFEQLKERMELLQKELRKQIHSMPRNPILSKLFRYARLSENAGYGIDKMLMWEQKRGKVDFTDDVVSSTIIFYFVRDDIPFCVNGTQGDTQGDAQGDTQGDTQGIDAIIIQEIRKNPQITTEELAQIANKGIATIKRHIAKLSDVRYVGSGYSGHWEIITTDR